ncbi:MAG: hypothetical protein AAGI48_04085 [Verrucomicrobiota bacterium]
MPTPPESLTALFIYGVVGAWVLALAGILIMRRYYSRKLEQLGESSTEEMIEELSTSYTPSARVRILTQTEYLPFILETVRENIDSGLDDLRVQTLLERVDNHHAGDERKAVFPVDVEGQTSDLRLCWMRDEHDRIDLTVRGAPNIIEALREQKRRIPKAVMSEKGKKDSRPT